MLEVVVVKGYSTKGNWVTSWASGAKNVLFVTFDICEVSGSVPRLIWPASCLIFLTRIAFVEYLAGGDLLHGDGVSLPNVWGETALVFVMKKKYQQMTVGLRMPVKVFFRNLNVAFPSIHG